VRKSPPASIVGDVDTFFAVVIDEEDMPTDTDLKPRDSLMLFVVEE